MTISAILTATITTVFLKNKVLKTMHRNWSNGITSTCCCGCLVQQEWVPNKIK